jgi:septal ring factor EnvC (AmiA/AmiB activator)
LQVFREAATRIKELEALLVGERTRADGLAEQLGRHTSELETTLADHQQRAIELEAQVKRLEAVEAHNRELRASLADLRDNTPASQVGMPVGSDDRVLELLADQQQRLAELMGLIMKYEDADVKIKTLQDALANDRALCRDGARSCGGSGAAGTHV